jgi:biotin carboxyl carrier protein
MESTDNFLGAPYYSSWDGLFYRLPRNKKKPFVKNGQTVKDGQPIGIIFINKNEQFVLNAPSGGTIAFPQEDKQLERGRPIKAYDQADTGNNEPLFYLK